MSFMTSRSNKDRGRPAGRDRALALLLCFGTALLGIPTTQAATASTEPLVQSADMTYLGAFRMPNTDPLGVSSLNYGGHGLTPYRDPNTGKMTIYLQGHAQHDGDVAQIQVPDTLVKSDSWDALPMATVLQKTYDVTDGKLSTAGDTYNGMPVYGMMVYNGRLLVGVSQSYGSNQTASTGVSGLDLSVSNDFKGFYPYVGVLAVPRALGGPMTPIPTEWQATLGGPALVGMCCQSVISATSAGPSATVFNPDDVGKVIAMPGKTALFYPIATPACGSQGCEAGKNAVFNLTSRVMGMAFPPGTRSVLFIGGHGTGAYCYGTAVECNDPALPDVKGPHAQPYQSQVWAYDANDLAAVVAGSKTTFAPKPYAIWALPDLHENGVNMMGAGFDPATRRLYIAQDYGTQPRIDVYQVGQGVVVAQPNPPTGVSVQ